MFFHWLVRLSIPDRLVTRLKKTRPLRGTHRTRKLRVALENACVFMEEEERKEEEEVEEEDD